MPMKPEEITEQHMLALDYARHYGTSGPMYSHDREAIRAYEELISAGLMRRVGDRDNGCPIAELTDAGHAALALTQYRCEGIAIALNQELSRWGNGGSNIDTEAGQ